TLVNFDLIYVEPNNVYYYDLPYQLYTLSEPIDLTDVSVHLFTGYTVVANAYCEMPYRLIWDVRSDGVLRCLTYYKTQKVQGWSRHDTQGLFVSVASIIEPPVYAPYFAVQRFIGANAPYMIERMDNRIWADAESAWCVDCGLAYPQPKPAATLTISSATGLGSLTGATNIVGGSGYSSAVTGSVVDQFEGKGSGAAPTLTFSGRALTGVAFAGGSQGSGYTQPLLVLSDPAGSAGGAGASARLTLNNATTLTTDADVFALGSVGSVVRGAGGIAVITAYASAREVTANVLSPFVNLSGAPIAAGQWTMTAPTATVSGLRHLAGATVTGLADGNVIPPTVVSADGAIALSTAASAIVVGLGFQCQFQDVPIDVGNPTVQGQRKKLTATTLRLEASRGVKVGWNSVPGDLETNGITAMLDGIPLNSLIQGTGWHSTEIPMGALLSGTNVIYGPGNPRDRWYDSLGGTINFIPIQPTATPQANISASYGSHGQQNYSLYASSGVHDGWSSILAYAHAFSHTFRTGEYNRPSRADQLFFKLRKSFEGGHISIGAYWQHSNEQRPNDVPVNPIPGVTIAGLNVAGAPLYSQKTTGFYSDLPNYVWFKENQIQNYIGYIKFDKDLGEGFHL
ncbi:MAG: hypothetical protein B7X10_01495, partial [Burkholderiales bacterium 21-58-4]